MGGAGDSVTRSKGGEREEIEDVQWSGQSLRASDVMNDDMGECPGYLQGRGNQG